MLIIKEDTEHRLKEMVEVLRGTSLAWRALTYRFSLLQNKLSMTSVHGIAESIINQYLLEREGSVFFCADGDIVIIGKALPKKTIDDLNRELAEFFSRDLDTATAQQLYITHDLGVDFENFLRLCRSKWLATAPKQTTEPAKQRPSIQVHATASRQRVLLVEDDPLSLRLAKTALGDAFTVIMAADGTSATEAYKTHAPDVVFLDIGLPDMSGQQVLSRLLARDPNAFVVMLSGNSTREAIMETMAAGAKGFVGKPFSKAKLMHYIEAGLKQRALPVSS